MIFDGFPKTDYQFNYFKEHFGLENTYVINFFNTNETAYRQRLAGEPCTTVVANVTIGKENGGLTRVKLEPTDLDAKWLRVHICSLLESIGAYWAYWSLLETIGAYWAYWILLEALSESVDDETFALIARKISCDANGVQASGSWAGLAWFNMLFGLGGGNQCGFFSTCPNVLFNIFEM